MEINQIQNIHIIKGLDEFNLMDGPSIKKMHKMSTMTIENAKAQVRNQI